MEGLGHATSCRAVTGAVASLRNVGNPPGYASGMNDWTERLKQAREARNLTQADLGRMLGVTAAAIGHWERGIREPTLEMLSRWGEALGVPVLMLVGDEPAVVYKLRQALPTLDDRTLRMLEAQLDMLVPPDVTKRHEP